MEAPLRMALTAPAPRLLELYLGALIVPEGGYLGIEFAGNILPSESMREPVTDSVAPTLPAPRSEDVLEAALEVQCHEVFMSKRVVLHAFETGFTRLTCSRTGRTAGTCPASLTSQH